MTIWSAEIKEIERLYDSIKGQLPGLEKELERLINASDENMVLVYARRCLEVIIIDLCESELKRPRKTEPLQGIIDKLNREEKIPSHIFASMQSLNSLSTFGSHPKEFDPEQVKPVLNNLTTIIKWYLKYKDTQNADERNPEEVKYESKELVDVKEGIHKSNKKIIILFSGLVLVIIIVIVSLFVFNVIGKMKQSADLTKLEKSIAVLPFVNDSPDEENAYFINGIMDEVLINLQTINELRVISRTSVEKYRKPDKPSIPEIAKELGVNYIVEGSGQKYGNTISLRVQLIRATKESHLWAESYEKEIKEVNDILSIQRQIAGSIATELKAIITPEEKQLINKIPTLNLTAYDFYQRGREEHTKYKIDNNTEALIRAEDLYYEALKYDSTFAQAYIGLAWIYWDKYYWGTYFSESFLDSVLILANNALSYNNQLAEAYTCKGAYYREMGNPGQALKELDKAIKFNPNDWMAYSGKGEFYSNYDLVKSIENYNKAISLNRGEQLPGLLRSVSGIYADAGFMEKSEYYLQEALKLDGDSSRYYSRLARYEFLLYNFAKSIEFYKKSYQIDSSNISIQWSLGSNYMILGQHEEALKCFKKYYEKLIIVSAASILGIHRLGWAYWQNGYKEKADYYFNEQINYCKKLNEMDRVLVLPYREFYDLAGVYAFRGEKVKAYENLRICNKQQMMPLWVIVYFKNDPLFNSIRNEPEFRQIVRDVEAKYQAEHERVRKWLEEQGTLKLKRESRSLIVIRLPCLII